MKEQSDKLNFIKHTSFSFKIFLLRELRDKPQTGVKYFLNVYLLKDNSKYIFLKKPQNSVRNKSSRNRLEIWTYTLPKDTWKANKHRKRCSTSLVIGNAKLATTYITTHLLEWLKFKRLTIPTDGKDAEGLEFWYTYTADGNVEWHNFGKQFCSFFKS